MKPVVVSASNGTSTTYTLNINRGAGIGQRESVKAFNAGTNDRFGRVVISRDGSTIAVAAIDEEGGSTGINGDESDNSAL